MCLNFLQFFPILLYFIVFLSRISILDWTIFQQIFIKKGNICWSPNTPIVFEILCLFYHWSLFCWKKAAEWRKILPRKKVEHNETFRYLHKIMLLWDTLEFKVETQKNTKTENSSAEKAQIHNFLLCIHCLLHWKIDGEFFLRKTFAWEKHLREGKMEEEKVKRLFLL